MLRRSNIFGSALVCARTVHHVHNPWVLSFESNRVPAVRPGHLDNREPGDPQRDPGRGKDDDLTDREWDLRVGQVIHHLRSTLPSFFETGLLIHPTPFVTPPSSQTAFEEPNREVYSPNVRLSYTPPFPLPPPFPRTIHIEGLTLYGASATLVRRTLGAFYSDLTVDLRRMSVLSPGRRERAVRIGVGVSGWGRVTDARAEWDVNSTYTFSPTTGLISHHRIESIDPAPHISVYDGLRASLQRFLQPNAAQVEPKRAFEHTKGCGGNREGS